MNFNTTNNSAKPNLYNIKIYTGQYLAGGITKDVFKALCLKEIDDIIDRDLELEGSSKQLSYILTKCAKRVMGIFDKIQNLYKRKE